MQQVLLFASILWSLSNVHAFSSDGEFVSYENFSVVSVPISSRNDIQELEQFKKSIFLWSEHQFVGHSAIGHVHKSHRDDLIRQMSFVGLNVTIVAINMQQMIDRQMRGSGFRNQLFAEVRSSFNYERYNRLPWITSHLKNLALKYSSLIKNLIIGQTAEGRDITLVRLGTGSDHVLVECGAHSREWISPAVCLWLIKELIDQEGQKNDLTKKYTFHLIPVLNPDGYLYTWHHDRYWRRNRQFNGNATDKCHGVDLNRNFDFAFDNSEQSVSGDPCDQLYAGAAPFSAAEARALRDYAISMRATGEQLVAYFSLHNYHQLWMYPYGHDGELAPTHAMLSRIAQAAVKDILDYSGSDYRFGTMYEIMYKVTGSSADWMYENLEPIVSYAIELRDKGQQGFLLMPKFIKGTGQEFWVGFKRVLLEIEKLRSA